MTRRFFRSSDHPVRPRVKPRGPCGRVSCLLVLSALLMASTWSLAEGLVGLYSRDQLFSDANFHPNKLTESYHPGSNLGMDFDPDGRSFVVKLQKGAAGRAEMAYIEEEIPYQDGTVRMGLMLDHDRRLLKAVVLAVSEPLRDTFTRVTRNGLITRYTATSVRQLKYLYKIQQGKTPAQAFLAREVWSLGMVLSKAMGQNWPVRIRDEGTR